MILTLMPCKDLLEMFSLNKLSISKLYKMGQVDLGG